MREIEIKARVLNRQALIDNVNRSGIQLSSAVKQHDVVYGQKGIAANAPGSIWLRIRTEDDVRTIFTFKQQFKGGLDSIEHETDVSNAQELSLIISSLGFTLYSDLTKSRQKAKYNGIEICIDDVEGLGLFIEAERLVEIEVDGDLIVRELWAELNKLGVDQSNEVFEGYDVLMNRRKTQA